MTARKTGELKKFFDDKGYGFIQTPRGDIFFHVSDSEDLDINSLRLGAILSYDEIQDSRSGKNKAGNIKIEQ